MTRHVYGYCVSLVLVCLVAFLPGCQKKTDASSLESHTLVYGGDMFLGKEINVMLYENRADRILGDLTPIFRQADLAFVNGEGVISSGGRLFYKGEPRPYMNRAHPLAVGALKKAGIDVVTLGNNHACDYGREALLEMQQMLLKGGLDYVGGGFNSRDARRPSYHVIGDTVVALVGADMTVTGLCEARKDRPGVLFYKAYKTAKFEDEIVEDLLKIVREARKHANLIFFTPHWGENHKEAPAKETRSLAKRLIRAGFDGIFGHSAHVYQGVELIDGKPVIYDAGNFLAIGGNTVQSVAWEADFNKLGVTVVRGLPIELRQHKTILAKGESREKILKAIAARSKALGTTVAIKDGAAEVLCNPGDKRGPEKVGKPPRRSPPRKIRRAPNDLIREKLPEAVIKTEVVYQNGVQLVGYRLFSESLSVPKAAQVVELFFKTDRKLDKSYRIRLDAEPAASEGNARKNVDHHIPGDWLMPTTRWPVGKIVTDRKLFRLTLKPEGKVNFFMTLLDKKPVAPAASALPLENESRVFLGSAEYVEGSEPIYHFIREIGKLRKEAI